MTRWFVVSILSFFFFVDIILADVSWTVSPFNPSAVPLAVRSPYLSAWLVQGPGNALNGDWAKFWTGTIVGWAGYVKVDGHTYVFLGAPSVAADKAIQKSLQITSTQSIFTLVAGPVDLTVTFLSPIEPADFVKQSLPFSYLSITAAPNDGGSHTVQVYTDISAEWITGNNSLVANWTTAASDSAVIHQTQLVQQQPFVEIDNHIQYGSAYYGTLNAPGKLTWQTGEDVTLRGQFVNNGVLLNTGDAQFRGVSDHWPVFALAHDLGQISSASDAVVFAVGHVRDPAAEYIVAGNNVQTRSLYFWSQYSSASDALLDFLKDYPNAYQRAKAFDDRITTDGSKISLDYIDVISTVARQAFGGTELTIGRNADGSFNTSDVLMFVKEISSGGRVSTTDVIFSSWPLYMYANPALGKAAILPLLEYQATGQYPNQWAVHDLGQPYPQALGHNDGNDLQTPIEESGNMLIMALSYTQKSGDDSLVKTYFSLLDQWTQYLIQNTITPPDQFTTDRFQGSLANQTNLAIKGILGINAMAVIASITGDKARASNYSAIASTYVSEWQKLATSSDGKHLTLNYGNDTSWVLAYNLYADKLLGTNLFPDTLYTIQENWYQSVAGQYGIALDSRDTTTLSGWEMWTAATANSTSVRDLLITSVHKYSSSGLNNQPFGDWYDTSNGTTVEFAARPVVGSHFAFLALPGAVLSNGTSSTGNGGSGTGSPSPTSPPQPTASKSGSGAPYLKGVSMGSTLLWMPVLLVGFIIY